MVASFKYLIKPLGTCGPWRNRVGKVRKKAETIRRFASDSPNIMKSTYPPVKLPEMPLHEYIFEKWGRWENKIAVECGVSSKKYLYKDLYRFSKNLAGSLQKKFKLKKGDCQCIVLPNCPEFPIIFLAGSRIGILTSPLNPLYNSNVISAQIDVVKPKIIFTTYEYYENCSKALNQSQLKIPIVLAKVDPGDSLPQGAISFSELAETPVDPDPVSCDQNDTLTIPFSSGTLDVPKAVELTHGNITANLAQLEGRGSLKPNATGENGQVVTLSVLPMFHIYGLTVVCLDALRSGDRLITLPKFEPKLFVETIYTKKTSALYLVPPLIFFLANQPAVEEKHLNHVRSVITGGAPCGPSDILALQKKCSSLAVYQGYGMTEASPVVTLSHSDRLHKIGSSGHPLSLTLVKVADVNTGLKLPEGKSGEICIKGPQVMKGYYNQPEATKNSFDSDGWLKTADIGYFDQDHDLFLVERLKELIKVKGFHVPPAEIEEVLRSHPNIKDAGVVGVPHPVQGEVPRAYVVAREGTQLDRQEVENFVKKKLSPYKQLKGGVRFVKSIPRTSAGKILRKDLKKLG